MRAAQRNHEIEMMEGQLAEFGHSVVSNSPVCLTIDGNHTDFASRQDRHAYLSGYLDAVSTMRYKQKKEERTHGSDSTKLDR